MRFLMRICICLILGLVCLGVFAAAGPKMGAGAIGAGEFDVVLPVEPAGEEEGAPRDEATLIVDDDYPGGAYCDGATYSTISAAVAAATAGDTVQVCEGVYNESVVLDKSLNIVGPQAGFDASFGRSGPEAVVDTANGDTDGAFVIQADGCTIDGFTIQNVNVGVNVHSASPPVGGYNGLAVRNCIVEHAAIDAINLNYHGSSTPALVEANSIVDAAVSGITSGHDGGTPGTGDDIVTQATIRGNRVVNAQFGITGYQSGSLIVGNVVEVDTGLAGAVAASGGVGIGGQLSGVTIRGNTVHGYDNAGGPYSTGIGFATYPNRPETTNVTIRQNAVYGNVVGIGVSHSSGTAVGIVASPGNLIYGNSGAGVLNATASLISATNNYWGSSTGPYDPVGTNEVPPCNGNVALDMNANGAGNAVCDSGFPAAGCSNIDYCPWSSGSGSLTMESVDTCIGNGQTQITIQVWSRDVSQSLTGWQAFVSYDTTRLAFNVASSSYVTVPANSFISHIRTLGPGGTVEISPGLLGLDGNTGIGQPADTGGDDKLATLVFDVVAAGWDGCEETRPTYTDNLTFYSELSLGGAPIPTVLVHAPGFTRDTVAPAIGCPENITIGCEESILPENTGSATASDNCDEEANVSYGDSAVSSCANSQVITRTWTATDDCGNSSQCQQTITVVDDDAPVLSGCPSPELTVECDAIPEAADVTAEDACAGEVEVTYSGDVVTPGSCSGQYTITRTWSAEDLCENEASCQQVLHAVDTTDPVITCPTGITVNADPGGCDAVVNVAVPEATDNCGTPDVTFIRSDGGTELTDPFVGVSTITWIATDGCGNTNAVPCVQTITVQAQNRFILPVRLEGVVGPVTRCIQFALKDADDCAVVVADVSVDFTGGLPGATGTADFTAACSSTGWVSICAKDEQHTLSDSQILSSAIAPPHYTCGTLNLLGGDTDNDNDIDINDVTLFLSQFGSLYVAGGCPWDGTRDADFSNNGARFTEDYSFLSDNWLEYSNCCSSTGWTAIAPDPELPMAPVTPIVAQPAQRRVFAIDTADLSPSLIAADLTGDGVVDFRDISQFEISNGLAPVLSDRVRNDELTARKANDKTKGSR